ncbi:hypothetical protein BVRB_6g139890 [Beta vulgaris subsp. vulgaris]|nr:hypothetical protein BVRB_6g139890 [Beta vulgaris subsp. vulgaris]
MNFRRVLFEVSSLVVVLASDLKFSKTSLIGRIEISVAISSVFFVGSPGAPFEARTRRFARRRRRRSPSKTVLVGSPGEDGSLESSSFRLPQKSRSLFSFFFFIFIF